MSVYCGAAMIAIWGMAIGLVKLVCSFRPESEDGLGDRQCFVAFQPRLYWLGGWECIVVLYRHKCRWLPCSVVLGGHRTGVDHERCRESNENKISQPLARARILARSVQNFILNTIGKVRVIWIVASVFKNGSTRNRFRGGSCDN